MISLIPFIVALLVLLGAGRALDELVAYRHKERLHDLCVRFWVRLSETPVPNLPSLFAAWVLNWTERILNKRWKTVGVYVIAVTAFLSIAAATIALNNKPDGNEIFIPFPKQISLRTPDIFDVAPLPHVLEVVAVIPFDMLMLRLSLTLLNDLRKAKPLRWLFAFATHFFALIVVGVACLTTLTYVDQFLFNSNALGVRYERRVFEAAEIALFNYGSAHGMIASQGIHLSPTATVQSCIAANTFWNDLRQTAVNVYDVARGKPAVFVQHFVTIFADGNQRMTYEHTITTRTTKSSLLLAGTLLYPILAVMLALAFLAVSKTVLAVGRRCFMYFAEVATEKPPKDFKPFFLLACSADVWLAIIKGLKNLVSSL